MIGDSFFDIPKCRLKVEPKCLPSFEALGWPFIVSNHSQGRIYHNICRPRYRRIQLCVHGPLPKLTYCKGTKVSVFVLFDVVGAVGGGELPLCFCNPPTTPPITAAATMIANIRPSSSQKCRRRSPHNRRASATGAEAVVVGELSVSSSFLVTTGVIGLGPDRNVESGDWGSNGFIGIPCPCFSSM